MNIIVCVKQVPAVADVKTDPETGALLRQGVPAIINPDDRHAIEAGLQLREQHGGRVTALSMGPPQARCALLEAYAMGVDDAVLLCDRAFAGSDTWATSRALAAGIRKLGDVDLIICGRRSTDGETAQTGPQLAEGLGMPQATEVGRVEQVDTKARKLVVQQTGDGEGTVMELPMPCLITVRSELNRPRYAYMARIVEAHREFTLKVWNADDLGMDPALCGLAGSPTRVVRELAPEPVSDVEMIGGPDPREQVRLLIERLRSDSVLQRT